MFSLNMGTQIVPIYCKLPINSQFKSIICWSIVCNILKIQMLKCNERFTVLGRTNAAEQGQRERRGCLELPPKRKRPKPSLVWKGVLQAHSFPLSSSAGGSSKWHSHRK